MRKKKNKLVLNGVELEKGDWLEFPFERGSIVGIDFKKKEVHVYDGQEGWTLSEWYENLGDLQFVAE